MTARARPEWIGKKPESMPGKDVLLRLYAKQDGKCACGCGRVMNLNRDKVDCDHIIPLRDGGENRESNLQLLLREHHQAKTAEENSGRAKAKRYQGRAFDLPKQKMAGRGFARPAIKYSRAKGCVVDAETGEPIIKDAAE